MFSRNDVDKSTVDHDVLAHVCLSVLHVLLGVYQWSFSITLHLLSFTNLIIPMSMLGMSLAPMYRKNNPNQSVDHVSEMQPPQQGRTVI